MAQLNNGDPARNALVGRGVDVSDVTVLGDDLEPDGHPLDNVGFVYLSDPDGNSWSVQQIFSRGA